MRSEIKGSRVHLMKICTPRNKKKVVRDREATLIGLRISRRIGHLSKILMMSGEMVNMSQVGQGLNNSETIHSPIAMTTLVYP